MSCDAICWLAQSWLAVALSTPCGNESSYACLKSVSAFMTGSLVSNGVEPSAQVPSKMQAHCCRVNQKDDASETRWSLKRPNWFGRSVSCLDTSIHEVGSTGSLSA